MVLIKNNISNEWKQFAGLCESCDICDEPKNDNISTNIIKYPYEEEQKDQEQQQKKVRYLMMIVLKSLLLHKL